MSLLNNTEITMFQGDIEALRLDLENKIADLSARVQGKVDCAPFFELKTNLNRAFSRIDKTVGLHQSRIAYLEREIVKLQQQNKSILSIIAIYNKSIKTE